MGLGGIGIWQLIILLVIIMLLFGTKKLRTIGTDLGSALKGFKSAMSEGEKEDKAEQERLARQEVERDTFDVKAEKVDEKNT